MGRITMIVACIDLKVSCIVVVWILKQGQMKEGFPKVRACHDAIPKHMGP
jgi:hypothetical protein